MVSYAKGVCGYVGNGHDAHYQEQQRWQQQQQEEEGIRILPAIEAAHRTWRNRVYAGAVEAVDKIADFIAK
ncbi:hypothetical protein PG999_003365 [Apiospora kogelbergensis]|uniref:Uncharacterized protein n=1 Tax=Apiospora kogelbergensis TaxID=1337665 RepID=A0AAW0R3E8_9PEZI